MSSSTQARRGRPFSSAGPHGIDLERWGAAGDRNDVGVTSKKDESMSIGALDLCGSTVDNNGKLPMSHRQTIATESARTFTLPSTLFP
jgi:endogenous inhibitor of DNA gyrase (YacG/DUF329 family)